MKVVLFGHQGWIGGMFANAYPNWICPSVRCDDKDAIENLIKKVQPTHIVSCIGRTSGPGFSTIDYLEQPGKIRENVRDNLFSPMILAILCKKYGIHLTYFGTGCIFSDGTFKETDKPNFFGSSYSIVKGYTDELVHLLIFCSLVAQ